MSTGISCEPDAVRTVSRREASTNRHSDLHPSHTEAARSRSEQALETEARREACFAMVLTSSSALFSTWLHESVLDKHTHTR